MVFEDHVGASGDPKVLAVDRDAALAQTVDLLEQLHRVDRYAVADHVDAAFVEDAGRDQVQDVLGVADMHCVARIRAPLVADDHVHVGGKKIDHLALSLVAPLGTKDT